MRGPKPKNIKCLTCDKKAVARGYCNCCYIKQRRCGLIKKLKPKILPDKLTQNQEEILIGSMLGDGCLYKHKPTHKPYFFIIRKDTDNVYAKWEANLFEPFVCKINKASNLDKRTKKIYHSIKFRTHRTDVFESYYQQWYPNGVKVIPQNITFTPLILAIWFCDDGHVRPSNSPWRMRLKLSTHGFSKDDVARLAHMLSIRYNEYFAVNLCNDKPIIFTSDNGTRKFIKEIDGYFPPGMERKMYWKNPKARFYRDEPLPSSVHIKQRLTYEPN